MRLVVLLGMLAGCDRVFQLSHVRETDAHADGPADVAGDGSGSATLCWDSTRTGDDDGDGLLDGCDPCPGNPDKTATDSDGDGIPDICDPEAGPTTILDFLRLHDFNGWAPGLGTWTTNGTDISEASVPASYSLLEYGLAVPANAWVELGVVGPEMPTTADTAVGLYLDAIASKDLTQGISCSVAVSAQGLGRRLIGATWTSGANANLAATFGGDSGTEAWVYARVNPVGCMADLGDGVRTAAPPPTGINRQPEIALTTGASTGVFKSITVFSSVAR